MKKLPLIGLLIGAVAAGYAFLKRRGRAKETVPPVGDDPSFTTGE